MTEINQQLFSKYFTPSKQEENKRITFENGSSIITKYKSKNQYVVKYLPGNYADYYSPRFIFKLRSESNIKVVPIPNFYTLIYIPVGIIFLIYYEKIQNDNILIVGAAMFVFILFVQFLLIIPSLLNMRRRINETTKTTANIG